MSDAESPRDDFEALLRRALAPVEPPERPGRSASRARSTTLTELAADELEAWELRRMRDPRNWVRPVAAAVVGSGAARRLVVLQARRRRGRPSPADAHPVDFAAGAIRTIAADVERAAAAARAATGVAPRPGR